MAITSVGYAGTVTDADWPLLSRLAAGHTYTVQDRTDFNATPGVGDRVVSISGGTAAGAGILDVSNSAVSITLPSVSSGSRWDLIGLRRLWSSGATTVVRVAGTANKVIPARASTPGIEDIQPLWLLRVAAGAVTIQEWVDLRCFIVDGGAFANDDLVRSYLTGLGTQISIKNVMWARRLDGSGNPVWVRAFGRDYVNGQLLILGSADLPTEKFTTGTSDIEVARLTFSVPESQVVDIRAHTFWDAGGNAAGTDKIKLTSASGFTLDQSRDHNTGSQTARFNHLFARVFLTAGTQVVVMTAQHESASLARDVWGGRIAAYSVS